MMCLCLSPHIILKCLSRLRNDFSNRRVSRVAFISRVLFSLILSLTLNLKSMSKKVFLRGVLTIVKYAITLALGYLGGSSDLTGLIN